MKRWTRLTTALAIAGIAATVGLSSAAANPSPVGGPATPNSGHASATGSAQENVAGITPAATLRPAKSETLFVPVLPCRIVDTRLGGGLLANNATRSFYIRGTFGFAPQGGQAGGCGVPTGASGVALNVSVTGQSTNGYLIGFPAGTTAPNTSFINYSRGVALTSNPTLALAPVGTEPSLSIKTHGSSTQVVIDVQGYYIPQIAGMIAPNAATYAGTTRILSAVHNGTGNYTVTVDTNVSYCTPTITAYSGNVYGSAYAFNNNKIQVFIWYLSGGTATAYDGYFYLKVDC